MEKSNFKLSDTTEDKDIPKHSIPIKDHDISRKDYHSDFESLKSDILCRVEFLEKEIKEFRRKPTMVDFSCQTERSHYSAEGDHKVHIDTSTQTYLENTNATLLNLNGRLEELKYYLNDKIEKLQYSLKHCVSASSFEHPHDRIGSEKGGVEASTHDIYPGEERCKIKYTPYPLVKPILESSKYRASENPSKPLDIRASLENSKQLFQQEIEASLQHGRLQQQANGYVPSEQKPSAFTQYVPYTSHVINSKYNSGGYHAQFYDGRRSMYYEKHPFQISREEYARELVDEIFAYDELAHANVTGVKGKRLLDQKKIQVIKDSVLSRYPLQPSESEEIAWKLICDKINTKCRGVTRTLMKRKANNSINGYPQDYYPMRKKGGENEYFYDMPPSMASSMYQNTPLVSPVGVWSTNERETDKSRDNIFITDPPSSDVNIAERTHELVVSDPHVKKPDPNITQVTSTSTNFQNNRLSTESSEHSEELINVSSRSHDDSNSNSLDDDHLDDRNNMSFSQSKEDNMSANCDVIHGDDNSDDGTSSEEGKQDGDNNGDGVVTSNSNTKEGDIFTPFPVSRPNFNATSHQDIPMQPSVSYPTGSTQSNISPANAFVSEERKFYVTPEGRKFYRQECSRGSRKELTRNLIDSMFSRATLAHSNVTGARGKSMLEPAKIAKVREMVFAQYPANSKEEEEVIWRKLTTKINTKCRGVKRFLKRKNMLEAGAISSKEHAMRDMDKNALRNTLGIDRTGSSGNIDKVSDYQYVSMVGRNSYSYEHYMRDIDVNMDKSMLRTSLGLDRYGAASTLEKTGESQYASMIGSTPPYNGRIIRDMEGNMDKSTLRSMLGLDRAVQSSTPEKLINSQIPPLPRGVSTPNDRISRDIDNTIEKTMHMNSLGLDRNVTCSTPEKINDYHYVNRLCGNTTPNKHIEHSMRRNAFSYDRTGNSEKVDESERMPISGDASPSTERRDTECIMTHNTLHRSVSDRNLPSSTSEKTDEPQYVSTSGIVSAANDSAARAGDNKIEQNVHRSAFVFDRIISNSTSEKIISSQYASIVAGTSSPRERIDIDSNIDKNIHRPAFGFDRNVSNNTEKLSSSQYLSMVGGTSSPRDRVTREFENNIDTNLYSGTLGSDRNVTSVTSEKVSDSQYVSMVGRPYNM